jgi:predicted Zn-dependent protease
MRIIEDEEAHNVLAELVRPILKAAELPPEEIEVRIIQDSDTNAFVIDNKNIFINSGLITFSKNPEVIAGVIAHECGHIAAGHVHITKEYLENLRKSMIASSLIGAAAALITGNPYAISAALLGGQVAQVKFLEHSRNQESQADGLAIRYLERSNISYEGLIDFLKYLSSKERTFYKGQASYLLTHPLSRERIKYIKENILLKHSSFPDNFKDRFELMVAKLYAFTEPFKETMRRYKGSTNPDIYAQSIAYFRAGHLNKAISLLEKLLIKHPNNPYFIELKAQFLYENGKIKESIKYYKQALNLIPTSNIFKIELAAALITDNTELTYAISLFRSAIDKQQENFLAWHGLGVALGKNNYTIESIISLAKASTIIGDKTTTQKFVNTVKAMNMQIKDSFYQNTYDETLYWLGK